MSRKVWLAATATLAASIAACGSPDDFAFDGPVISPPSDAAIEDALTSSTSPAIARDETPFRIAPVITPEPVSIEVDRIAGFGVNAEPRAWGSDGSSIRPSIDLMVKDLGATIFRLGIKRGQSDWEQTNDDADPAHIDWDVFDRYFGTDDFSDLYEYIRYLNGLGVDAIQISAHGLLPAWMGSTELLPSMEPEFVESMVAFLLHATTRSDPRINFRWFSPWNETDLGPPEGIDMEPEQQVRVATLLVAAMRQHPELDGIRLVMPEALDEATSRLVRERSGPDLLDEVAAFSSHRYGAGFESDGFRGADPPQWLSEFNAWVGRCFETEWQQGLDIVANVITALRDGFTAAMVWNDFDGPHLHQDDEWQTFGLFAAVHPVVGCGLIGHPSDAVLDSIDYQPKPTYRAFWHVARFVRPGAERIALGSTDQTAVAFRNTNGSIVIVGMNPGQATTVVLALDLSDQPPSSVVPVISTSEIDRATRDSVAVRDGVVVVDVPARSVYTLVSTEVPS